jgi:tetratricopeptide (TPR) repeat protein
VRRGDIVNFTLKFDSQGRPRALNVTKAEDGTPLSVWDELPEVRAKKARELYSEALIARNEKDYPRARQLFEQAISLSPERNFFEAYAAMEKTWVTGTECEKSIARRSSIFQTMFESTAKRVGVACSSFPKWENRL